MRTNQPVVSDLDGGALRDIISKSARAAAFDAKVERKHKRVKKATFQPKPGRSVGLRDVLADIDREEHEYSDYAKEIVAAVEVKAWRDEIDEWLNDSDVDWDNHEDEVAQREQGWEEMWYEEECVWAPDAAPITDPTTGEMLEDLARVD